ncbi:MAG: tRNA (adenosine(37)-N6)-threonylcarbamoyltransferase complex ATPase subunit type 1 TsaE [Alphaproteobacteria bacterium]
MARRRARDIGRLDGPAATKALAASLAPHLRAGDVIALEGELGTGKTTFARGLIAALGGVGEVPSPTFTMVQAYDTAPAPLWHFDLYRLATPADAYELGIEEAVATAISVVEWPDRLGALLPRDRLDVRLAFDAEPDVRRVRLVGYGAWAARLAAIESALPSA